MGTVTITLTVNDGIHESTQSADIRVIPALIVPGKEAAGVRLGEKLNEVIGLYGEPNSQINVNEWDGVHHDIEWHSQYNWENAGLTVYSRNNRVFEIEISAPNTAKTEGGNGIGSNCDDVIDELTSKFGKNKTSVSTNHPLEFYQGYIWKHAGIEVRCRLSIVVQLVIRVKEPGFANLKMR